MIGLMTNKNLNIEKAKTVIRFLRIIYGTFDLKLKDKELFEDTVKLWAVTLENLSLNQIKNAMEYYQSSLEKYEPTPVQFALKAYGHLNAEQAWIAVITEKEPNDLVKFTKRIIGTYNWTHLPEKELKAYFISAYEDVCQRIMSGANIDLTDKPVLEHKSSSINDTPQQNFEHKTPAEWMNQIKQTMLEKGCY